MCQVGADHAPFNITAIPKNKAPEHCSGAFIYRVIIFGSSSIDRNGRISHIPHLHRFHPNNAIRYPQNTIRLEPDHCKSYGSTRC